MRQIFGAIIAAGLLSSAVASCGGDDKPTLNLTIDPETTPTMLTRDVSSLISDSGITRYHITSPIWYVYGEASEPKWTFPDGLFLEKFDNALKRDATIECDSATYFEKKRTWRLDGNVKIMNMANERFLTEQLFWDQRSQRVYSDSFIHIERQDRIIEGYGFNSNDRLTEYEVRRVSGIFPVSQFTGSEPARPDSTAFGQRPSSPMTMQVDTTSTLELEEDSVTAARRRVASRRPSRMPVRRPASPDTTAAQPATPTTPTP